ncbi:MAG TPA: hypothetical protein VN706_01280 [Gemmatimonadaceae bacterium]|nr:hypothetical protein [Gemmatimonadaceae bacterium]
MTEEPIDFTPLDPTRDRDRFEATLGAIHREVLAARHRSETSFGAHIAALAAPALIAVALVLAVAVPSIVRSRSSAAAARVAATPNALGIPPRLAALMRRPDAVSIAALDEALRGSP